MDFSPDSSEFRLINTATIQQALLALNGDAQ